MRHLALLAGLSLCGAVPTVLAQEAEPVPIPPAAPEPAAPEPAAAPAEVVAEAVVATVETAPAEAATDPGHYFGVLATLGKPDSGRDNNGADISHSFGAAFFYGYQWASQWGLEAQGFTEVLETGDARPVDWYRYGLNLDLVYAWGDRSRFTPFVLLGVGGNRNDVSPLDDGIDLFGNVGLGFVTGPVFKTNDVRVRGEVRYVYDNFQAGYGDARLGLGIEVPIFGSQGASAPAATVEAVKIVEVQTGLLDSDGDGVVDGQDQCPDTPAGSRVDGTGCPLPKVLKLHGVTFELEKARLRPDAKTILGDIVLLLKKYPDMKVEIAGHTDSTGSQAYNQKLSEERAAAVRAFLIESGVPEAQVSSRGYGELEPVADNASYEGRELNRRVELRILD